MAGHVGNRVMAGARASPFLQRGSSVKVAHVPLFHSLVCPGVIVTPAHSTLLLPPVSPGGEEADSNIEVEVGQCGVF